MNVFKKHSSYLFAAAFLVGCGGSGGDSEAPAPDPQSFSISSTAIKIFNIVTN